MYSMNDSQFDRYSRLIYDKLGIFINNSKKGMIESKIRKLMFGANVKSYEEYYDILTNGADSRSWTKFVDEITVHKTDFFRENSHFEFIRNNTAFIMQSNPRISKNMEIRVWSAGCSTGEEPYTIAMILNECLKKEIKVKILGTDISSKVIETAVKGIYSHEVVREIDGHFLEKYFVRNAKGMEVVPLIKEQVVFRTFNLAEDFPFKNLFDIIFCRNVMIYFDSSTQEKLIRKFYDVLAPGGLFMVGHSESLIGRQHRFKYVQPTIYMKPI